MTGYGNIEVLIRATFIRVQPSLKLWTQMIIRNGVVWWHSGRYGCIWGSSLRLSCGRRPLSCQFVRRLHRLAVVVQSTSHSSQFVVHSFQLSAHQASTIMSRNQVFH